jgi:hypothetical protein
MHRRRIYLCCILCFPTASFRFKEHILTKSLHELGKGAKQLPILQAPKVPSASLELDRDVKVYGLELFKNEGISDSLREKKIFIEGLQNHPRVTLTTSIDEADFILYLTVQNMRIDEPWMNDPNNGWNSPKLRSTISKKLILVDFADAADDHRLLRAKTCTEWWCTNSDKTERWQHPLLYFKRSWLYKFNGTLWLDPALYKVRRLYVFLCCTYVISFYEC